jgi:hypothetical protein
MPDSMDKMEPKVISAQHKYFHDSEKLHLPSRDTVDRVGDGASRELHGEDDDDL